VQLFTGPILVLPGPGGQFSHTVPCLCRQSTSPTFSVPPTHPTLSGGLASFAPRLLWGLFYLGLPLFQACTGFYLLPLPLFGAVTSFYLVTVTAPCGAPISPSLTR